MQVFRRQAGQSIRIGDEILVQVIEVEDGGLRLGVVAPRDVAVVEMNANVRATSLAERDVPAVEGLHNGSATGTKGE